MKPVDTKVMLFSMKLIVVLCAGFLFSAYFPQHAHYLLLAISVALIFTGSRLLFKYRDQTNWTKGKAVLKIINESEEVTRSEYSSLKYFYPEIEYEYVVNGTSYLGKVVAYEKENVWVPEINNWGDPTPKEKRWWLMLKPGDELPVYINPLNLNEAVLINSVIKTRRSHHSALIVSGLLVGLIWLFMASANL